MVSKKWTNREIEVLKKYYPTEGAKGCLDKIDRPISAIRKKASKLKINVCHRYTDYEIDVIRKFYPLEGVLGCVNKINRSKYSISYKAIELGISYKTKHEISKITGKRTCIKCNKTKLIENFTKIKRGEKIYYTPNCTPCIRNSQKNRYKLIKDNLCFKKRSKIYSKKYYSKNRQKLAIIKKKWIEKNKNDVLKKNRKLSHKYRLELKDHYVKRILQAHGFHKSEITPELIELKKAEILIHRINKLTK